MVKWKTVKEAARKAAATAEDVWRAVGKEVWCGRKLLATFNEAATAEEISAMHNVFLSVFNRTVYLASKLQDLRRLKSE